MLQRGRTHESAETGLDARKFDALDAMLQRGRTHESAETLPKADNKPAGDEASTGPHS